MDILWLGLGLLGVALFLIPHHVWGEFWEMFRRDK